jgi:hypothetical protein
MTPIGRPGPLTERERFMFETSGYLVIPNALSQDEVDACLDASRRAHEPLGSGQWRQIGHLHESEPAIETLLDHSAVLPKARALLGDYFIVQSTWCTLQPAHSKAGGYHRTLCTLHRGLCHLIGHTMPQTLLREQHRCVARCLVSGLGRRSRSVLAIRVRHLRTANKADEGRLRVP